MMDFDMGPEVAALRTELRGLVADELEPGYLGAFSPDPDDLAVAQQFCKTLAARDLLCPAWPAEFGGRDASAWEQTAMREEMWAFHEPRGAQYMGVNWVGPTIMRHGTVEQQALHLPLISEGDVIWCQGFSEPDAGSDLASLKTAAVRDGASWRINGQKIWTSYATMAQWCFLLARTSKQEARQQGLTIFLLPMDRAGIEVRPIDTMMGPHHLNEVFFSDVEATDADILGAVDDGWSVVQEVLSFERVGIARYARCERLLQEAPDALGDAWDDLADELVGRWLTGLLHSRRARLLAYRVVELQDRGQVTPGDSAAYRIAVTANDQTTADILADLLAAAPLDTDDARRWARAVEDHIRYSVSATVASGSTEVQRILLSRSMLSPGGAR